MSYKILFAIVAIAVPLVCGGYNTNNAYNLPSSSYGLEELANAAAGSQQGGASITSNAEVQPTPAEAARLGQAQNQLQALNANPTYRNLQNSEAIAESLAETNMATRIRQGNLNIVSPNVVDQGVFRSTFVPSGRNSHQILATPPLPPIVVTQPGAPPQQVSSGPAAIVRAAPVIYKIKPSVIYQQEVINKVPTPLSLNPVYVKVYKPGKQIDAPVAPVVQPVYNQASYAPSYGSNSAASDSYASNQQYASPPAQYNVPSSYSQNTGYAPANNYGAPDSYVPAGY